MSLVEQLPALIGAAVGGLGSYVAIAASERGRFRREQSVRWDERRMEVYVAYGRSVQATLTLLWRVGAHRGVDPHPHPLVPADAATPLAAAYSERDLAWESLLLTGRDDVIEAARAWHPVVSRLARYANQPAPDPVKWQAAVEETRTVRQKYYAAARADLAVPAKVR